MTTLPTVNNEIGFDKIAEVIGQDTPAVSSVGHTILKINRDIEDDDGRSIPPEVGLLRMGTTVYARRLAFSYFFSVINIFSTTRRLTS